ncbi:MAG: type II toxin-antitoxin system RelE/ParE family toxin [Caldisericia bacterium]
MTSRKAAIVSSSKFQIAETLTFQKKIASRIYKPRYAKIKDNIYPALRTNPFLGPNIKRLKGELSSIYRYRIGDYRLFYTIDFDKKLVFILDITHRKDAYR